MNRIPRVREINAGADINLPEYFIRYSFPESLIP
jgi:hypothetical protein